MSEKEQDTNEATMTAEDARRLLEAERDDRLRRMDIDGIHVRTGESFVEPLTRFFRAREARR